MRLLFVFRDPGRIRYFEAPLVLLAQRGHDLRILIEEEGERVPGQLGFVEELAGAHPNVRVVTLPRARASGAPFIRALRLALDFLHYRQQGFAAAPDFRASSAATAPRPVVALARLPGAVRPLRVLLAALERGGAVADEVDSALAEHAPDLLAVTPYVQSGAGQTDWIRAARRRGVHSVACVFSWDNLTSKGSMRELPERMTVWNVAQCEEAATLHQVPRERIDVTGAQNWDHWFDWAPRRDRVTFCREVGLDPARPYLLWLESSGYVGGEDPFVAEWVSRLRAEGGPCTRSAAVLVRPHPQRRSAQGWGDSAVAGLEDVAIFPSQGQVPLDERSRRDFYDSIWHSAAVVGVNTSAFIESAILGRACLTLELERFRKGQVNTLHFQHLLEANGGPLRVAPTWEEHLAQLEDALAEPDAAVVRGREFVARFVRPHGLDAPAAPCFVGALEKLADAPAPAPARTPRAGRALLATLARLLARA